MLLQIAFALATGIFTLSAASAHMPHQAAEREIRCTTSTGETIRLIMPMTGLTQAELTELHTIEKISSMQDIIRALQRHIPFFREACQKAALEVFEIFSCHPAAPESLPAEMLHWSYEDGPRETIFDIIERANLWERLITLFLSELRAAGGAAAYASEKTYRIATIGIVLSEIVASNGLRELSQIKAAITTLSLPFRAVLGKAPKKSKYSIQSLNKRYGEGDALDRTRQQQCKICHLSRLIEAIEESE